MPTHNKKSNEEWKSVFNNSENLKLFKFVDLKRECGKHVKFIIECKNCHTVSIAGHWILESGYKCKSCEKLHRRVTDEKYIKLFNALVQNNEYELINFNRDIHPSLITVKHNPCGNTYSVAHRDFIVRGYRCQCLNKYRPKTLKHYDKLFKMELDADEYLLNSVYRDKSSGKTRVYYSLTHKRCSSTYDILVDNFLNIKSRCPHCNNRASKGEKSIQQWLISNKIEYTYQYTTSMCKNIRPLPFDFAILNNGKLTHLIEYQGEQHYRPMRYKNGDNKFKEVRKHDEIKRKYCKLNNISLIEIPYTDFKNIDAILHGIIGRDE